MRKREILDLLERHGVRLSRGLGQHILVAPDLIRVVADAAGVRAGDGVLEVGPGPGILTVELARRARMVWAVEIDRRMVEACREALDRRLEPDEAEVVELVHADVLKGSGCLNPEVIRRVEAGRGEAERLVAAANLPYNIATPFVIGLLDGPLEPERAGFLVQKEVAERWTARTITKTYGAPSLLVQARMRARIETVVGPGAFHPPPRVSSAVVRLDRASDRVEGPAWEALKVIAEAAFRHRRKMLRTSLAMDGRLGEKDETVRLLREAGVAPTARVEQLEPADLYGLARRVAETRES